MGAANDLLAGLKAAYEAAKADWLAKDAARDAKRAELEIAEADFGQFVANHPNANGSTYHEKLNKVNRLKAELEPLRNAAQEANNAKDIALGNYQFGIAAATFESQNEQAAAAQAAADAAAQVVPASPAPSIGAVSDESDAPNADPSQLDLAKERRLLRNAEGQTVLDKFKSVYGNDNGQAMMDSIVKTLMEKGQIDRNGDNYRFKKEDGSWGAATNDTNEVINKITKIEGWENPSSGNDYSPKNADYLLKHTKGSSIKENFINVFGTDDGEAAFNAAVTELDNNPKIEVSRGPEGSINQITVTQDNGVPLVVTSNEDITRYLSDTSVVKNMNTTLSSSETVASTTVPDTIPAGGAGPVGNIDPNADDGNAQENSAGGGGASAGPTLRERLLKAQGNTPYRRFANAFGEEKANNMLKDAVASMPDDKVKEHGSGNNYWIEVKTKNGNWVSDTNRVVKALANSSFISGNGYVDPPEENTGVFGGASGVNNPQENSAGGGGATGQASDVTVNIGHANTDGFNPEASSNSDTKSTEVIKTPSTETDSVFTKLTTAQGVYVYNRFAEVFGEENAMNKIYEAVDKMPAGSVEEQGVRGSDTYWVKVKADDGSWTGDTGVVTEKLATALQGSATENNPSLASIEQSSTAAQSLATAQVAEQQEPESTDKLKSALAFQVEDFKNRLVNNGDQSLNYLANNPGGTGGDSTVSEQTQALAFPPPQPGARNS